MEGRRGSGGRDGGTGEAGMLTLETLDVVGHGLDVLLAAVHPLVEGVVGGAPRHRDVLVHVQLQQQLLLRTTKRPESISMRQLNLFSAK